MEVFLNTQADIRRIVCYIGNNPRKARLPEQSWDFVNEYDGWMAGYWEKPRQK